MNTRLNVAWLGLVVALLTGPAFAECPVERCCPDTLICDDSDEPWSCCYVPSLDSGQTHACGAGPVVRVDATNGSEHTISREGAYFGFRVLLEADGYEVLRYGGSPSITVESLNRTDILVIVNPVQDLTATEAASVAHWVSTGGSLLLVADHDPRPAQIQELAEVFGIEWYVDYASGFDGEFSPEAHPISEGFGPAQRITRVESLLGSSLDLDPEFVPPVPYDASEILVFPRGATGGVLDCEFGVVRTPDCDPIDGRSQGIAIQYGEGRVYASGEAQMFTARCPEPGLLHSDNQQFLLNVMHWLDGTLTGCGTAADCREVPCANTDCLASGVCEHNCLSPGRACDWTADSCVVSP